MIFSVVSKLVSEPFVSRPSAIRHDGVLKYNYSTYSHVDLYHLDTRKNPRAFDGVVIH